MMRPVFFRYVSCLAVLLLLSACGFALRGQVTLPFSSIYITLPDTSTLGAELKRNIRASGNTKVVNDAKQAEVVLESLDEKREKIILSLNDQGRVREYDLRYTFRFRVRNDAGKIFMEPVTILLHRNISFNESVVLAKESEEALLYRDMQSDLVQQIMRRLAAMKMEAQD